MGPSLKSTARAPAAPQRDLIDSAWMHGTCITLHVMADKLSYVQDPLQLWELHSKHNNVHKALICCCKCAGPP